MLTQEYYENVADDVKADVVEGGNRLATILWYLEAPSQGGDTHFPCAETPQQGSSFICSGGLGTKGYPVGTECGSGIKSTGVKVQPVPGRATLFYSLRPDGAPDGYSLHAGCPPEGSGDKWAVNKCELSAKACCFVPLHCNRAQALLLNCHFKSTEADAHLHRDLEPAVETGLPLRSETCSP